MDRVNDVKGTPVERITISSALDHAIEVHVLIQPGVVQIHLSATRESWFGTAAESLRDSGNDADYIALHVELDKQDGVYLDDKLAHARQDCRDLLVIREALREKGD